MKRTTVILLALLSVFRLPAESAVRLPVLERDGTLILKWFPSAEEAERTANRSRNAEEIFRAGYYLYYKMLEITSGFTLEDFGKNASVKKSLLENAVKLIAAARKMEPANPYYAVIEGEVVAVYGLYLGYPKLVDESNRSSRLINEAIDMDPENPELRMIRFLSFSNRPYQFYPQLKPYVIADFKAASEWLEGIEAAAKTDPAVAAVYTGKKLDNLKDQLYFAIGRYYHAELKDRKTGEAYFARIRPDSPIQPVLKEYRKSADVVTW